jgi:pimeloyl-ACP methyl ester carboxylesterase
MFDLDQVLLEGPPNGQLITFIHGWPDDLHLWDSLVADLLATNKYRCLRVTLPGYGDTTHPPHKIVDPDFHQVAALVAQAIQHHQHHAQEQSILIAHDWGSVVAFQLQRRFSHLIQQMIVMDVGPTDLEYTSGFKLAAGVVAMGLYYQWLNMLAYYLWRYVPVVGPTLGDAIHRFEVRRFKTFPNGEMHPNVNLNQSASSDYFYHYFQKEQFFRILHLQCLRGNGGSPLAKPPTGKNPSVPTLFLHGNHRGSLGKQFKPWSKALNARKDSDVVVLNGNHWFMLNSPKETSAAVINWLGLGKEGGKLNEGLKAQLLVNKRPLVGSKL